jgi:periplasmic divalent cation tolerance protein
VDLNVVYMTFGNKKEARSIGKILVEERLVACVNIIDSVNSLYIWQDKLQDDQEVIMIAKTASDRMEMVIERVKALHSYECPCIVGLQISAGNPEFLNWITGTVR